MNNHTIENVIILGAGASKSEKAPLQGELINKILELLANKKRMGEYDEYNKLTEEYFEKFWNISINTYQNMKKCHTENDSDNTEEYPTFEECLGILDLAYLRGECFRGCSKEDIIKYRDALIFSIAKTLEEVGGGRYHRKLVDNLKKECILKKTAFISLNYDIFIDNALIEMFDYSGKDYYLDYGIPFINYEFDDERGWEKPEEGKSVLLLKPHGSLNWLYCPTCNIMELTPKIKGAIKAFYKTKICVKCGTKMEPVIIPPTFYKDMSNPFIQQIYLKADEVLRSAKRIFICGYSFPDADMHIKYLLKRAEMFNGDTPKIYVINWHKKKEEEGNIKWEINRIKRFFKNKENIIYTNLSFEEFAKKGIKEVCENIHKYIYNG